MALRAIILDSLQFMEPRVFKFFISAPVKLLTPKLALITVFHDPHLSTFFFFFSLSFFQLELFNFLACKPANEDEKNHRSDDHEVTDYDFHLSEAILFPEAVWFVEFGYILQTKAYQSV